MNESKSHEHTLSKAQERSEEPVDYELVRGQVEAWKQGELGKKTAWESSGKKEPAAYREEALAIDTSLLPDRDLEMWHAIFTKKKVTADEWTKYRDAATKAYFDAPEGSVLAEILNNIRQFLANQVMGVLEDE